MKKIIILTLALIMLLSAVGMSVSAEAAGAVNVYVTVSDANGKLALAQERISVTDIDNDGAITVNDALYTAHEAKYEGGAAAGYESVASDYGLSLNRLWGTANGGSYGYYINNTSAWSLVDPLKEGDYLNAFVYTDLTAWSDTYCYFDKNSLTAQSGEELTLTLSMATFDAEYNPVTLPVEGATVIINGKESEYKTDADGKVTLNLTTEGVNLISAVSESVTLVPPVCMATVEQSSKDEALQPPTDDGDNNDTKTPVKSPVTGEGAAPVCVALLALAGLSVLVTAGKKFNED